MREIDRRVRYLSKSIENLKVVDYSPEQEGRVFFGAWVEIENEEGKTLRLQLVGYDEIFARKDCISIDSPMARALIKKQVDDTFQTTPNENNQRFHPNKIKLLNQSFQPNKFQTMPKK